MSKQWLFGIVVFCLIAAVGRYLGPELAEAITALAPDPNYATAVAFLSVFEWIFKLTSLVLATVLVVGMSAPLWLAMYFVVEKRKIPGPLDDWIAYCYAPVQRRISKETVISFLKWSAIACATVGGVLVGSNTTLTPYGFIFLASSSGQWLVASLIMKDKALIALNTVLFFLVDSLGVYRWLLS